MKSLRSIDFLKTSSFVRVTALTLFALTLFLFLFTHFSPTSYSSFAFSSSAAVDAPSPEQPPPPPPPPTPLAMAPHLPEPKVFREPPLPPVERMGVLDGNGVMTEDFRVGELDPGLEEEGQNGSVSVKESSGVREKVEKYKVCDVRMVDFVPCLDNEEVLKKLEGSVRGEKYERHCPQEGMGLNCLVPPPKGYRRPVLWPKSRDEVLALVFCLMSLVNLRRVAKVRVANMFSFCFMRKVVLCSLGGEVEEGCLIVALVWFSNVPHTRLVEDKGGQNWISIKNDKFVFPGGGTQFIHGADKYLDQISEMVPDISFGKNTRVALDVGCGVASFGAFLMQRNVTTFSIAPKDVHENQIQFALERGVPAMAAVFATHRLLFPSQAFDLIHCSRCRINWTRDGLVEKKQTMDFIDDREVWAGACVCSTWMNFMGMDEAMEVVDWAWMRLVGGLQRHGYGLAHGFVVGGMRGGNKALVLCTDILFLHGFNGDGILLLEANRLLRAGGYFVWAAQPVYKHEEALQEKWKEMENLTANICWELVRKEGYIAIWQKPMNNNCYLSRDMAEHPPLCESNDDPDNVWYVNLKACITELPSNGFGANVTEWPLRLHEPPKRLQSIQLDAIVSRDELFRADTKYWFEIIESYVRAFRWKEYNLRNVMDMRAGFGGVAAALLDLRIDCWVMNVVPVSGFNTLPVIYDRGLIGVVHDWCEPFDTYPRTYDLLHAAGLFSVEKKRKKCNISSIMLEMDRILRPGGRVYIRDTTFIIGELEEIATALGWSSSLNDVGEGPYSSWKILRSEKPF
ncbi:methyltransferase protein [Vigna angularis]|uniref:Methyltransferase protein n=1 Tax=Phaseolus angularis TaxID=3914 RepID=A0A8T0K1D1_PHAAN|nr:methyltransferase protein [Vigna angularis]